MTLFSCTIYVESEDELGEMRK